MVKAIITVNGNQVDIASETKDGTFRELVYLIRALNNYEKKTYENISKCTGCEECEVVQNVAMLLDNIKIEES